MGASGLGASTAGASTESQLKGAKAKLAALEDQIATAEHQASNMQSSLSSTLRDIDATRRKIEDAGAQLDDLQARETVVEDTVTADQAQLDQRAAEAYEDPFGAVDVVLGATSIGDLQSRLEFVGAVARSDQALIDTLQSAYADLAQNRLLLEETRKSLQASKEHLASQAASLTRQLADQKSLLSQLDGQIADAQGLVQTLRDRRAMEIAAAKLAKERAQQQQSGSGGPPPTSGSIDQLISDIFAPLGSTRVQQALCVADHESSDDPDAVNPHSGASGVFQFLPDIWPALSSAAGYGGASVFEATANVGTAEWDVANFGWADWESDAAACGL